MQRGAVVSCIIEAQLPDVCGCVRVSIMMPSFFRTFLPAEFIVLLPVGPCSYTSINRQFGSSLPVSVGGSWALYALLIYSRLIFFNSNHRHLFLWLVDQENSHFAILHYCTPFASIQQWLWCATVSPTIKGNFEIAFFLSYNFDPISKSSLQNNRSVEFWIYCRRVLNLCLPKTSYNALERNC